MGRISQFLMFVILSLSFVDLSQAQAAEEYPPLEQVDLNTYHQQIQAEVAKQGQFVQALFADLAKGDALITKATRLEYERALGMYNVKQILLNNFKGTQSLRSPAVRARLLSIMRQQDINEADLMGLDQLVRQEKAKIGLLS